MNTIARTMPLRSAEQASAPAREVREAGWFMRLSKAVWAAFEASGHARAQRHILAFADRCESLQPDLAKELRAAALHTPSN